MCNLAAHGRLSVCVPLRFNVRNNVVKLLLTITVSVVDHGDKLYVYLLADFRNLICSTANGLIFFENQVMNLYKNNNTKYFDLISI